MTTSVASGKCMVLDTMCLMHYALADRLDVLGSFLEHTAYSTIVVRGELLEKSRTRDPRISNALGLPWLEFDPLDTIEDLRRLADWKSRVGADEFHTGEASVFAVAEKVQGIAITDDSEAVRVARRHGLEVHGNLWILAKSCGDEDHIGRCGLDCRQPTSLRSSASVHRCRIRALGSEVRPHLGR